MAKVLHIERPMAVTVDGNRVQLVPDEKGDVRLTDGKVVKEVERVLRERAERRSSRY